MLWNTRFILATIQISYATIVMVASSTNICSVIKEKPIYYTEDNLICDLIERKFPFFSNSDSPSFG